MNVFCPNCENECSEQAPVCPKCGHPLGGVDGVDRLRRGRRVTPTLTFGRRLIAYAWLIALVVGIVAAFTEPSAIPLLLIGALAVSVVGRLFVWIGNAIQEVEDTE